MTVTPIPDAPPADQMSVDDELFRVELRSSESCQLLVLAGEINLDAAGQLLHAAESIARDPRLRAVVVEHTGYDAHRDADPRSGPLASTLAELADALRAFHDRAIAPAGSRPVALVTLSEFGRTIGQNADRGTDHGDAGAALILGRDLPFSGIRARWPGLAGRSWSDGLPVTTDVRDVIHAVSGGRTA